MQRRKPKEGSGRTFKKLYAAATFLIGVSVTGSHLPTAFPLIAAVERLSSAGLEMPAARAALASYVLVYAVPLLLLV